MRTISPFLSGRQKAGRNWTAADNLGSLVAGRRDRPRKPLKQRPRDDAHDEDKHRNHDPRPPIRCLFGMRGDEASRGLNRALLSFTACIGLSFRRAKGMSPYKNALWVQAEITTLMRQPPCEV